MDWASKQDILEGRVLAITADATNVHAKYNALLGQCIEAANTIKASKYELATVQDYVAHLLDGQVAQGEEQAADRRYIGDLESRGATLLHEVAGLKEYKACLTTQLKEEH